MIKLPEPSIPAGELGSLNEIYQHEHPAYFTEAQLKQAVRDALEEAVKVCDNYAELCEREQGQTTLYGTVRASASQVLANEIRALIKEIPE